MINTPYRDDLNKIVVLNPKGGCGKTTLATNLASYFALRGPPPTLIDADPQGYTSRWLERRPADSRKIKGVSIDEFAMRGKNAWSLRAPKEAGAVIIDTPGALGRREIAELTHDADCILVPILPSAFDIHVTTSFVATLLLLTDFDRPVAIVANRTRQNTKSLAMLLRTLTEFETPTIAVLRNSQNFVRAASLGLGIYELPRHMVKQDIEQMDLIISWLDQQLMRLPDSGLMSRLNPWPKLFASASTGISHAE